MRHIFKIIGLSAFVSTALLLTGCERSQDKAKQSSEITQDDQIMRELSSEPVKAFAKTPEDVHDIQALTDFDQRFSAVSDDMEDELMRMKEEGSLTPEFAAERKRDNINSALRMLKELDLKTAQGRYIQGLMYQYWDNQNQLLQPSKTAESALPSENIQGLGQFIHAQEQLDHWQAQYPELQKSAKAP